MNILENAKPENRFYCADGTVLRNVQELGERLKAISVQAFYHHVTPSRNDFHNWIRDVYQDPALASELLKAKLPFEAAAIVRKHVAKAIRAKEEIETAIAKAQKTPAKISIPADAKKKRRAKKRKTPHGRKAPRQKPHLKNRKVNKKRNKMKIGKAAAKKTAASGKERDGHSRKKGRLSNKRVKNKVKGWLNWLKLVPEL